MKLKLRWLETVSKDRYFFLKERRLFSKKMPCLVKKHTRLNYQLLRT